jgi:hypothetical protein
MKIGLGRCGNHSNIKNLHDEELAWQVEAGTAWRRLEGKGAQLGYYLPTLGALAHAMRNNRGLAYDYSKAKHLYLAARIYGDSDTIPTELRRTIGQLIDSASERWAVDLQRKEQQIINGTPYLAKLRTVFDENGLYEVSRNVAIADFVPAKILNNDEVRPPILFIRLPNHLREGVANQYGMPRKAYAEAIGCSLKFEKDER